MRHAVLGVRDRLGRKLTRTSGRGACVVLGADPDDRDRLAPIALAREQPVAELEVDRRTAALPGREIFRDAPLGLLPVEAGVSVGMNKNAVAGVRQFRTALAIVGVVRG